jgi:hypothetical protein
VRESLGASLIESADFFFHPRRKKESVESPCFTCLDARNSPHSSIADFALCSTMSNPSGSSRSEDEIIAITFE